MVMSVWEVGRSLEQWEMNAKDVHRRMLVPPTPRERKRWRAVWLLDQGWTAVAVAEALERDPHSISPSTSSRWASAFGESGPAALIFEQTGGSPRPRPDTAGGVEKSDATAAAIIGHGTGQLALAGGAAVCMGAVRTQPEPQQLLELPAPIGIQLQASQEALDQGQ